MQDTCRNHTGNLQETNRKLPRNTQDTCRTHAGNLTGTYRKHAGSMRETYRKPARNLQEPCRKPARNLQETCRNHSGNLQETHRKLPGNIVETCNLLFLLVVIVLLTLLILLVILYANRCIYTYIYMYIYTMSWTSGNTSMLPALTHVLLSTACHAKQSGLLGSPLGQLLKRQWTLCTFYESCHAMATLLQQQICNLPSAWTCMATVSGPASNKTPLQIMRTTRYHEELHKVV